MMMKLRLMKNNVLKSKKGSVILVIGILLALTIVSLVLGGTNFTWQVLQNYLIGAGVGAGILLLFAVLRRTPAGRMKFLSRKG
jgi:hypothetical protein